MHHRFLLFLFLLLLLPVLLVANNEAAPLIKRLSSVTGVAKVDLLNEISVAFRRTDRYASLDYARQAFELSVTENYSPGKALAKKNEGICWFFMGNNDSAVLCYQQALESFKKINDKQGISACYNNLGLIAQETGKYDDALRLYQLSIDMDIERGDISGAADTKGNLVDIYIYQGNSKKALSLSNEIISECSNNRDTDCVMRSLINRAAIYDNLLKFDAAIIDLKYAIALARELGDSYAEAMALSNFGLATWHKGNPEEALKILNNVLDISTETNDGYDVLNTLWIMSEIYSSQKEYARSNEILLGIIKRYEEMDNKRQVAKVLTSLGRNLTELNEIDKAMGYFEKSLEITVELDAPFELLENYRNLAHVQAILHNFDAADSLQDLFAQTHMKIFNSDSIQNNHGFNSGNEYPSATTVSNTSDWIIALSLIAVLGILSVIAYRGKREE
jgi:tetratricopeptide (TPR) repeat protein